MRHFFTLAICLCVAASGSAVQPPVKLPFGKVQQAIVQGESLFNQLTPEEIATLKKKEIRTRIGRKLTIKEWVGMKMIKRNYRKATVESKGQRCSGLVWILLGILSLVLLTAGPLVLAFGALIMMLISFKTEYWQRRPGMQALDQSGKSRRSVWRFLGELILFILGSVTIFVIGSFLDNLDRI